LKNYFGLVLGLIPSNLGLGLGLVNILLCRPLMVSVVLTLFSTDVKNIFKVFMFNKNAILNFSIKKFDNNKASLFTQWRESN